MSTLLIALVALLVQSPPQPKMPLAAMAGTWRPTEAPPPGVPPTPSFTIEIKKDNKGRDKVTVTFEHREPIEAVLYFEPDPSTDVVALMVKYPSSSATSRTDTIRVIGPDQVRIEHYVIRNEGKPFSWEEIFRKAQ